GAWLSVYYQIMNVFKRVYSTLKHFHRALWQGGKKSPAVGTGHDSIIQDHHDAVIAFRADETADALAQFQDRFWKRVFRERVAAVRFNQFQLRLDQRMIGHRERQPRDDHIRERVARHIHAHPKTVRPEKNAARRRPELLEQFPARRALPLHE